jgi:prevent-host-death family protein
MEPHAAASRDIVDNGLGFKVRGSSRVGAGEAAVADDAASAAAGRQARPSAGSAIGGSEIVLYSHIGQNNYWSPGLARRSEKSDDVWTVADAKARLSEVIERAQAEPQVITRNGKPSAIVVSIDEWSRKTARKGTLAEFLLASPLRGGEVELDRLRDEPRDLRL